MDNTKVKQNIAILSPLDINNKFNPEQLHLIYMCQFNPVRPNN